MTPRNRDVLRELLPGCLERKCSVCKEWLSVAQFHSHKRVRKGQVVLGWQSACKACRRRMKR